MGADNALGTGNVRLETAELRASSNATISGNIGTGIPLISVAGNQTGTFSAAAGQTLTLAPLDFLLVAGSTMRVGSSGNTGTVLFAPNGAVALAAGTSIAVDYGTLQAGNSGVEFLTAIASATTVAAGATLDFQDHVTSGGIFNLQGGGTVNVGANASKTLTVSNGNFSGSITGAGGLLKTSAGTLQGLGTTYAFTFVDQGMVIGIPYDIIEFAGPPMIAPGNGADTQSICLPRRGRIPKDH